MTLTTFCKYIGRTGTLCDSLVVIDINPGDTVQQKYYCHDHRGERADMPLTKKGRKIMRAMKKTYGKKKGKNVFYASQNSGRIKGTHKRSKH